MTALARRSGPSVRLRYRFENVQREPVELWVSLPPDGVGQLVEGTRLEPSPAIRRCGQDSAGVNEVAYLVLDPGDRMELDAKVRPERRSLVDTDDGRPQVPPLPDEERRRYLRQTPMVPTGGAVAEEARRIVQAAEADDDHQRAWALFSELALNYLYIYPPTRRGAAAMLEERAGDCGEFSFLFAAWCRSCGIPARTIVGTWARGKTQAHVWSEFHLDGVGWVPADASMAALAHRAPWQVWLMGRRPRNRLRYFGALPGHRVAFNLTWRRAEGRCGGAETRSGPAPRRPTCSPPIRVSRGRPTRRRRSAGSTRSRWADGGSTGDRPRASWPGRPRSCCGGDRARGSWRERADDAVDQLGLRLALLNVPGAVFGLNRHAELITVARSSKLFVELPGALIGLRFGHIPILPVCPVGQTR